MNEVQKLDRIKKQAREEIAKEDFRIAVDNYKIKLREAKWWHRVFPYVILIRRRG